MATAQVPLLNQMMLRELAEMRLEDARVLLDSNRDAGAYYVAGYAVECALKACIAKQTKQGDFPDKDTVNSGYTHSLSKLVGIAGLPIQRKMDADNAFLDNWNVVKDWSEQSRYHPIERARAENLLQAIDDADHGVLPWLREHW